MAGGTTVTFRIVPYAATSPIGSWWITGSGIRVYGTVDTPLPVSLLRATAEWKTDPEIKWTILHQTNNKKFIIERSTDNEAYMVVGEMSCNDVTSGIRQYSFTDYSAEPGQIFYYYRLCQQDIGGAVNFLHLLPVSKRIKDEVIIDNTNSGEIVFHFSGNETAVEISNVSGQVVYKRAIAPEETIVILSILPGLYLVRFDTRSVTLVKKAIVKEY